MNLRGWLMLGVGLYVVMILFVIFALVDARRRMVQVYAAPDEQTHWEQFSEEMRQRHQERESLREEISRHSGQPVEAAPPKTRSERPPTLELLENHFAACLAACIAGVTLLFALMWGLFMGTMLRPGNAYQESPESDTAATDSN